MKQNGIDYNFGRMLKIVLWKPGTVYGSEAPGSVAYEVEFCPYIDPAKCPKIEATITDLPSADKDDKPGFSADVVIYNPHPDLVQLIAQNATWILRTEEADKLRGAAQEKIKAEVNTRLQDFYKTRLQVSVYAGYWTGESTGAPVGYVNVFRGYLNESSFFRQGQENILAIRCHDINMSDNSTKAIADTVTQVLDSTADDVTQSVKEAQKRYAGYVSWDKTFKKFVVGFAPQAETVTTSTGLPANLPVTDRTTDEELVSMFGQYYKVYYVKSRSAFEKLQARNLSDITSDVIDENLKNQMESIGWWNTRYSLDLRAKNGEWGNKSSLPDWTTFHANASNRGQALNTLCTFSNARVAYHRYETPVDNKIIYIVYRLGSVAGKPVKAELADVKIWNYQNLLETPSVAGNGQMTIKMMFNPECRCWRTLSLILSEELTNKQGFASLDKIIGETSKGKLVRDENGNLIASLKSQTGIGFAAPINQLSGTMSVNALRTQIKDAIKGGYMFNTGFPIVNVVHKLTTHDSAWMTTVKTVPVIRGMLVGEE